MREYDNSKIHISSNFLLSIVYLITDYFLLTNTRNSFLKGTKHKVLCYFVYTHLVS